MSWQELNEAAAVESAIANRWIDFGVVQAKIDYETFMRGVEFTRKNLLDDAPIMSEIAELMVGFVRRSIDDGTYLALTESSIRRRRYPWNPSRGYGTRGAVASSKPLVASGAMRDGILPRSRQGYAAARRGDEWYGFLHDRGVGRVDERHWMQMTTADEAWAASVYDEWLGRQIEGDEQ